MSKLPGRPKSDDPKVAVTFRIKASVLAAYQAEGDDWRARIEAAVERMNPAERAAWLRGDWAEPEPSPLIAELQALAGGPPRMVRVADDEAIGYVPLRMPRAAIGSRLDKKPGKAKR